MNEIKLKDLYLCAFLLNENQNLIRMDNDGHKFWFVFKETKDLNELTNAYWKNQAITKVKSYVNKVQDLKDRIFSEK